MLSPILVGMFLTAVTITIHAIGTTWWLGRMQAASPPEVESEISYTRQLKSLCLTALVLLTLHIVEVIVWAVAYLLVDSIRIQTFEEAIYFSMVTFAALGYGDIVIESSWRLVSGIQSMTGLLVFGWSTAMLFAVVQKIWEYHLIFESQSNNTKNS